MVAAAVPDTQVVKKLERYHDPRADVAEDGMGVFVALPVAWPRCDTLRKPAVRVVVCADALGILDLSQT